MKGPDVLALWYVGRASAPPCAASAKVRHRLLMLGAANAAHVHVAPRRG